MLLKKRFIRLNSINSFFPTDNVSQLKKYLLLVFVSLLHGPEISNRKHKNLIHK